MEFEGNFSSKLPNFVKDFQLLNIMEKINIFIVVLLTAFAVQGQSTESETAIESIVVDGYTSVGDKISNENTLSTSAISDKYALLAVADTVQTKFAAEVIEVCQSKGCWMKLQLQDGKQAMVRFKDYGFFMPKDLKGKEVIVNGLAFVEEMSVADQKHFAKDAGKSEDEIAKIVAPKKSFGFEADGVLIKQ